jgi:hypothetical protein
MKKVAKSKLSLETITVRVLSGESLGAVVGAKGISEEPYPSYGKRTCHTGSGCSNCDKCWTWTSGLDFSCACVQ